MNHSFTCKHCQARLPSVVSDNTCPECGGLLSTPGTDAGLEAATIKPGGSPSEEIDRFSTRSFGDYELLEEIARGGMGVIFRARQSSLDRIVALKMILEGQLASQVEIDRFKIEAQAAAHLDHSGIVQVFDHGVIDGRHYIAMAFIDGESLAERIQTATLSDDHAARILLQITDAIDYAHQRGVIHRDLKPANILIDGTGNTRISDFGLAKRRDRKSQLTVSGQMLGTPSYMAPEQASSRGEVTDATDIYALGAILYAMLSGKPPFEGATLVETISKVIEQEPLPLKQVTNNHVSPDLETICFKCLEKDPADRYPTAAELGLELKRFLNGEPIEARPLSALAKIMRWRKIVARNNDVRLQSATKVMGFPLVDIAFGRDHDRLEDSGHAKGIIAYGDRATGVIAVGGFARGVFAFGLYAIGLVSFGMFSAGLFTAGLFSLGLFTSGGLAIGLYAFGLMAIGYKSIGLFSLGLKSWGLYRWSISALLQR